MSAEHRPHISEQYKKKIENIVRKPAPETDDAKEVMSPCMYCAATLADSLLDCANCKNISPFCIFSGMRMLRDDWSYCPSCKFPARRTALTAAVQAGDNCPMCDSEIKAADVPVVADASAFIQEFKSLFQA